MDENRCDGGLFDVTRVDPVEAVVVPVVKTFRRFDSVQQFLLPPSLDEWLPAGHMARFVAQFRADAVELVLTSGRPIAQRAPELGINEGTLSNWVSRWREEHPRPIGRSGARWSGPSIRRCWCRSRS